MGTNQTYERNLDAMVAMLDRHPASLEDRTVGLELERFLVRADGTRVFFSGERGVGAVIRAMVEADNSTEPVVIDGTLLGLSYDFEATHGTVRGNVSLEPGAQIELSCGPATTTSDLYEALLDFDRRVEDACHAVGLDARLMARGYDPEAARPEDVELIPKERYRLMDSYLPTQGRYARDMMRCSASTQVSVDYLSEDDARTKARRAAVLGPVWAFLFDNSPVFRTEPTPGMARARIWDDLDPERCGQVPGALEEDFGFRPFCEWIASVRPILMTDAGHRTYPTGDATSADVMSERELTDDELLHLVSMTWPSFRLKGFVELREMDSLPPYLACACASLCSTLMYDADLERRLRDELGVDLASLTSADVAAARSDLEDRGWDATPYGIAAGDWAAALARVAGTSGLASDFDRDAIAALGTMWAERRLPRDLSENEIPSPRE